MIFPSIVGVFLFSCGAAAAEGFARPDPPKVLCGAQSSDYMIRVSVEDIQRATRELNRIFSEMDATLPLDGCGSAGFAPGQGRASVARWIPSDNLDRFRRALLAYGGLEHYQRLEHRGDASDATIERYVTLRSELQTLSPKLAWTRALVSYEIGKWAPALAARDATRGRVFVAVSLTQSSPGPRQKDRPAAGRKVKSRRNAKPRVDESIRPE